MKGFVTIATGNEKYYKMAANLLLSYRHFSKEPYPFAIIADRENEYTRLFDRVVLLPNPHSSYLDKIELLTNAPFAENIFIDADCLAYGDLNRYWSAFENCTDFSAFGLTRSIDQANDFYDYDGTGIFKDQISYLTHLHGGIYYIRQSEACKRLLSTCRYIIEHYGDFTFKMFRDGPADETVFALAMSVEGMKSTEAPPEMMCFYPCKTYFKSDISKGLVEFSMPWFRKDEVVRECYCVHWGNYNIAKPVYQLEAYRLKKIMDAEKLTLLQIWTKRISLHLSYVCAKVMNKLHKTHKNKK